jgi:cytochrome P450
LILSVRSHISEFIEAMTAEASIVAGSKRAPIAAPRAAYFDDALHAWILSSYADVSSALYEPQLWPVAPDSAEAPSISDQQAQARVRRETLAALPNPRLVEWIGNASQLAHEIVLALPDSRPVDVLAEFVRPWSLALAVTITGAHSSDAPRLAALAEKVTRSTAAPEDSDLKEAAAAAETELAKQLSHSSQPMAGPAFIAISQTLPALIANGWHILFRHESEFERLRSDKTLMPKAVEELLRLGGLAGVVHRRALADVTIRDIHITRGQRVDLLVRAANHDPQQFPEPERFDPSRNLPGQFALGAGSHLCAAAALIRMAIDAATRTLVDHFTPVPQPAEVVWLGGSGFQWPERLFAQRRV